MREIISMEIHTEGVDSDKVIKAVTELLTTMTGGKVEVIQVHAHEDTRVNCPACTTEHNHFGEVYLPQTCPGCAAKHTCGVLG